MKALWDYVCCWLHCYSQLQLETCDSCRCVSDIWYRGVCVPTPLPLKMQLLCGVCTDGYKLKGVFVLSPQPVVTSQMGTVNNIIQVKKTDFEVFDALMVDSQKCSDVSGACQTGVDCGYIVLSHAHCATRPRISSSLSYQTSPALPLGPITRRPMFLNRRRSSNHRPYSHLICYRSSSTKTLEYL